MLTAPFQTAEENIPASIVMQKNKVVILSNVYDQPYHDLRGEQIDRTLGAKRAVLFQCLADATSRELMVLSSPPKAALRRSARWLAPVATRFAGFEQLFCGNWDAAKVRVPLAWFFYTRHVFRHVRDGDLVVIDNYEFLYVIAAWWVKLFRRVTFILDYEDGKHLIDHSWVRVLSALAEWAGKPLIKGALLANPKMSNRLPSALPVAVVPGFIPHRLQGVNRTPASEIRFLYSGSMDGTRGLDLLLAALPLLPDQGWRLDITGQGPLAEVATQFTRESRWSGRVTYHGSLPPAAYNALLSAAHVGLNCQRASDPISDVTFPSKVFTYLAAGLLVVSSRASAVEELCGNACCYYPEETPESLAGAMKTVMTDYAAVSQGRNIAKVSNCYSVEATTNRLRELFKVIGITI